MRLKSTAQYFVHTLRSALNVCSIYASLTLRGVSSSCARIFKPRVVYAQRGFTLVEVVIGMALLSAAMLIAAISYSAIIRLQQKGATGRTTQQNGRYALEAIARDIRSAASVIVPSATSIVLTNSLGDGGTITYSLSAEQLMRQTCVPDASGVPVCADLSVSSPSVRVTQLSIEQAQATGAVPFIKISIRVEQKTTGLDIYDPYAQLYNLTTTVTPRYY